MFDWAAISAFGGLLGLGLLVIAMFWKHIDKRFDQIEAQHRQDMDEIEALRREIYRDFVRREDHNGLIGEMRTNLTALYNRLNTCAEQLNQMVGRHMRQADGD